MKPVFMRYTKNDIINFVVLLVLGFLVIPNVVTTDYWYTSILIPWLCLTIAALGQNIVMGCKYRDWETDRKSTRLNSSHSAKSRMPSSA